MTTVELRHGAATDVGLVREANEDAHLAASRLFVVADGMGGHDHGDVASRIVVEEFAALDRAPQDVADATTTIADVLAVVHGRIDAYDAAHRAAGEVRFGSGTTAVVAALVEDRSRPGWLIANLGDSRAYRFAAGVLTQVTVDHSLVQELVDAGTIDARDADHHPDRHIVTRALGGPVVYQADFFSLDAVAGDRVLLCTDGVSGMLSDQEIERILAEHDDPEDAARAVVAAAVEAGGHDNATAVIMDVVGLGTNDEGDTGAQTPVPEQETRALP